MTYSKAPLIISGQHTVCTRAGVARQYCLMAGNGLELLLEDIQSRLLDVGAAIATPRDQSSDVKLAKTAFPAACTMELECAIDELDSKVQSSILRIILHSSFTCGQWCSFTYIFAIVRSGG
eukprot:TRINITY_DN3259_c0_g1_i4.p4 TRINITY_DN3259_c0_g1~~TRINITY_DN3259_c0_g1_i4.p4  ORF type:complete len:121 (-),score=21.73 TRINITY_DN3259_c0_g1_i4:863-1225(-)